MKNQLLFTKFIVIINLFVFSQFVIVAQENELQDTIQYVSQEDNFQNTRQENVVAQMNYCINTLTNIVHNKSIVVLEHETDQLVNNLTMEQITGLYEIKNFRVDLLDAVSRFEITEEEKNLMKRVRSLKRDMAKWNALSSALSPTMLVTGGGNLGPQVAFQVLLTAARSIVEYQVTEGEQQIEELQALWELRKEDMKIINDIRKSAQNIVYDLYKKYHLNENDRLTEKTSNLFNQFISEKDAAKRARLLHDNYEVYESFPPYYYHLGMAYVDLEQYDNAKPLLNNYLQLYNKAPILRYDEKTGCIALTKLSYEKQLSCNDKEILIQEAIKNLPSNSAAVLQCALVYLYEIEDKEKGFELLRLGIDDPKASDKEILYMASSRLLSSIKNYPKTYSAISKAIEESEIVGFDTYFTYMANNEKNAWESFSHNLIFENISAKKWYKPWSNKTFLRNKFTLSIPQNLNFEPNNIRVFFEEHNPKTYKIKELDFKFKNGITIKKIEKKSFFKSNRNLKFLFLNMIVPNEVFTVKENLDYDKIKDESFPRMSEFILTEKDVKGIIKFCKKNESKTKNTLLSFKPIKSKKQKLESIDRVKVYFEGDSLLYTPFHSHKQDGYYLRVFLSNDIMLMYKYDIESKSLTPYFYNIESESIFSGIESKNEYEAVVEPKLLEKVKSKTKVTLKSIGKWISKNIMFWKKKENQKPVDFIDI